MLRHNSRLFHPLCWLGLFFVLLAGCGKSETGAGTQDFDRAVSEKELDDAFVFAALPYDVPTKVQLHFEPLLAFLSEILGKPVKLYVATSYEDQIKQIATGKVDFAYLGPTNFVTAFDKFTDEKGARVQPIVTEIPYQAAIVVHKNSPIQNIQQLKHASMAFGSYYSYTGHFWIRHVMKQQGIRLADLKIYSFMGRHERAAVSVANGDFDAAATTLGIAERLRTLNYPIRVIYQSDHLAPIVLVAAPHISREVIEKLQKQMLMPDFEAQEKITLFAPGGRYLPFSEEEYDSVRGVLNEFE